MNVDGIGGAVAGGPLPQAGDARLKEACRGVEGIFLAMLLKEGMRPLSESEDNQNSHSSALLESTLEQVANQMAGAGSMGIAKMLYEQVAGAAGAEKGNTP